MLTRRCFVALLPSALAGCAAQPPLEMTSLDLPRPARPENADYSALQDGAYTIPAVDLDGIDPRYLRQQVDYDAAVEPGTIVVDPQMRFAYLVQGGGKALRYGVGVGREEAFNFQGAATIKRKAVWPHWTPTPDMIRRDPARYAAVAMGLPGGPGNPLGPRALYLYRDGQDSLYRLHGTTEPDTIGTMVSSGCVRFFNQDIIDLHRRVPIGTRVVVLPSTGRSA